VRTVGGVDVLEDKTRVLTFVPPDTISRMPVISTGFRGFARRQGLKASSMGRAARGSGDIKTGRHGNHRGSGG
jgi:hypothetical protein